MRRTGQGFHSSWSRSFREDGFLICHDVAHVARWEPRILHAHVSWVGSVLCNINRFCTTSHNGRLGSTWSRSWSIWSVCPTCEILWWTQWYVQRLLYSARSPWAARLRHVALYIGVFRCRYLFANEHNITYLDEQIIYILTCRLEMLCRICRVQILSRKHVLDHADYTAPTPQRELFIDHTDQESICPAWQI